MAEKSFLTIDLHHEGIFSPKPLAYSNPEVVPLHDLDFSGMNFSAFFTVIRKITGSRNIDIYHCLPHESLSEGLGVIQNEGDYREFLECGFGSPGKKVNVYIDHHNEPLFDWIELENPDDIKEDDFIIGEDEEEEEAHFADGITAEHQEDEVETTIPPVDDPFLNLLCSIQEEAPGQVKKEYPFYNPNMDWDKMVPVLGMKFSNPGELKELVANYAVKHGYPLWYEKTDKNRVLVNCGQHREKKCPFRLWATWLTKGKTFQIKTLIEEHNCSRIFKLGSIVTYKWVGKQFVTEILERPKMSYRKMKAYISKKFNLTVSAGQCRNARKYALTEIEGNLVEHYGRLWDYGEEIRRSNPGSTVQAFLDRRFFKGFYVCFKGVRDGWVDGCRRVISIDGCFLKGICKGELIAAVGRDANDNYYPLAWAVVVVENKEMWRWFLDLLMDDTEGGNGGGLTIISDGHKGLIEAMKDRVPDAEHSLCARHILANFRQRFDSEEHRKMFWKVVYSTTPQQFQNAMEAIKEMDQNAFDYLMARSPEAWSRAYFLEGRMCDAMENGVSESFNAVIREMRRKPVISLLEDLRLYVMQRLYNQRIMGMRWDLEICPSVRKEIEDMKLLQRFWVVYPSGYQQFEVKHGDLSFGVDLTRRECDCRSWQLKGIPCLHVIAAIASLNLEAENYVHSCFTKETFLKTYSYSILPMNGSTFWPKTTYTKILPPISRRLPGRPKTKKRKGQFEKEDEKKQKTTRDGVVQRCSYCQGHGHKKNKCPKKVAVNGASGSGGGAGPVEQPVVGEASHQGTGNGASGDGGNEAFRSVSGGGAGPTESVRKRRPTELVRKRRHSERIMISKLGKHVLTKDGKGLSADKPVVLK